MTKWNLQLFVEKANEVHENKYNYSKSIWKNTGVDIVIICPIHGEFIQKPSNHLQGKGCQTCSNRKKVIRETFIQKANKVHNNKYNYSEVFDFKTKQDKVKIICPDHGLFEQTAHNHQNGQGCPRCTNFRNRYNTDTWIHEAKKVHGEKYIYDKAVYTGTDDKIEIKCPIHGYFWQIARGHLNGYNCFKCVGKVRLTKEEFIRRAIIIHGQKYDYTESEYVNSTTKIKIRCKVHGFFYQKPPDHLEGNDCPKCIPIQYSKECIEWLDYISRKDNIHIQHACNEGEYKINDIGKVDGFCKQTNTVYEYHGSFFHGNPDIYQATDINPVTKLSYGLHYQKTLERDAKIKTVGYNLISIWDKDWYEIKKKNKPS